MSFPRLSEKQIKIKTFNLHKKFSIFINFYSNLEASKHKQLLNVLCRLKSEMEK